MTPSRLRWLPVVHRKYVRTSVPSAIDVVEPRIRALLSAYPQMPATVIAERVGWTGSISWFRERVRAIRPEYLPADPVDRLEPDALAHMSDAQIAADLITVKGVGRWSAELFLMFQLRRLDVWPTGDLSVRQGYAAEWGIDIPTPKQLDTMGDAYRPYRSLVAWYCWQVSWEAPAAARGKPKKSS